MAHINTPLMSNGETHPRTGAALERLNRAMADIESEITQHKGVYPYNHGRVTQSELCRRADVKKATLQNSLHKDSTRVEIIRWLEGIQSCLSQSREGTRERVTAAVDDLTAEVERLSSAHAKACEEIAQLQKKLSLLNPARRAMLEVTGNDGIEVGARLRHYKGGLYEVIGSCVIEATMGTGVLYRPLQGDRQDVMWMRPVEAFFEEVSIPEGKVARFVHIES